MTNDNINSNKIKFASEDVHKGFRELLQLLKKKYESSQWLIQAIVKLIANRSTLSVTDTCILGLFNRLIYHMLRFFVFN